MKVDKQNQNVCYNDEKHLYWDDNGKYISVTTLIGKFGQEYDKEFWSGYKALEKLLKSEEFKIEKDQLLKTHKINPQYYCDMYGFTINDFNREQQNILDDWAKTNKESCDRGTAIHAKMENLYTPNKDCSMKKYGLGGKFQVNTNATLDSNNKSLLDIERGVFPEYLIYWNSSDGKFKLAGQIDLLIKDGNDIYVIDYKTNKKLDDKSFFDQRTKKSQMMKYPMNNLMDCNKVHYTLQLSTYAWMLQKLNPAFIVKKLVLIHFDHKGNVTEHEVNYLRDDVIRMCKFYKKQARLEQLKESRKPIEF